MNVPFSAGENKKLRCKVSRVGKPGAGTGGE